MTVFIQYLVNGLSMGSVYAIIALGYTMVYGIAKMLNFAHGDVIMVGAYVSFCATSYLGLPGWASVVLSCVVCTVLGVLIEGLAYKPLRQAGPLAVLITAIGVSYFLQNAAQLLWGATPKNFTSLVTFPVPEFLAKFNVSAVSLVTIVACLVIMAGLMFFTGKTKMGKAMRAVSEDKAAAQLMGINVNRTISMTFAIGSALAAIAAVGTAKSHEFLASEMRRAAAAVSRTGEYLYVIYEVRSCHICSSFLCCQSSLSPPPTFDYKSAPPRLKAGL